MNKKLIGAIIAVVIVLVGGYYYASPYLVLNSIKNAAQAGDSEKVSAYMDYPSVRQSFKDQMNAYMVKEMASKETNGWEALGTMIATTMVDKMVDAVVTPEGMTLMLQGKDFKDSLKPYTEQSSNQTISQEKLDYSTRYLSMNMFEVTLKNPNNEKQLKIIMERDGLSWKVKKFVIPMDEVKPQQAAQQPIESAVEIPTETEIPTIPESTIAFDFSDVQIGEQVTVIPLNASGVSGVLWSDAETYLQACHNYTGEMMAGIQLYGYNVQDNI